MSIVIHSTLNRISRIRWSRWACALVLCLGALGLGTGGLRAIHGSLGVVLKGAFWQGRDPDGRSLRKDRLPYPLLERGEAIHVLEEKGKGLIFKRFAASVIRETEASTVELCFHESGGRSIFLTLAPRASGGIRLEVEGPHGKRVQVARETDREFQGAPSRPIVVSMLMGDRPVAVEIDGEEIFRTGGILRAGGSFSIAALDGSLTVRRLHVDAVDRDEKGRFRAVQYDQDLSALPAEPAWPKILEHLALAGLALLALCLFLRSLCPGRPRIKELIRAELLLLLPASLYFATGLFRPVVLHSLVLVPLVPAGLAMALFSLRRHLREEAPFNRFDKLRSALASLVLIVLTSWTAGAFGVRLHEESVEAERAAQAREIPSTLALKEQRRLGPQNAWTAGRRCRNLFLKTQIVLEEGAVFQVRVRAIRPNWAQGVSLFLSSDPRFENRFHLETRKDFEALGEGTKALPANERLNLTVEARGRHFNAYVNGRRVAFARERLFAEGEVILLAAKGFVQVRGLTIEPATPDETAATLFPDRVLWASAPLAFLLFYALLASLLMAMPFLKVLEWASLALLPLLYGFGTASPKEPLDVALVIWTLFMASLFLLIGLGVRSARLNALRYIALVSVLLLGAAWAALGMQARAWPADFETIGRMTIADWSGDRLEKDFLHVQHPLFRRWNGYLAEHKLRGRSHDLQKPAGRTRILCLGASSTYGYRVEFPYGFHLERLLKQEGRDVEVMIGAVQGANAVRQYHFLENVLKDFSPDIVTLSLFNNDLVRLLQIDEAAYIEEVTAPSYERSFLDRLAERLRIWMNTQSNPYFERHDRHPEDSVLLERGPDSLHYRFEAALRSFAGLAETHGFKLVLIKEPLAGDMKTMGKEEFYAAMDRVGRAFGLPVLDPTPLLNARGGARLFLDRVHPNEEGHAVMAEALLPVIRALID